MLNSNNTQTYLPTLTLFEEPGVVGFSSHYSRINEIQARLEYNRSRTLWAETCTQLTSQKSGRRLADDLSSVMGLLESENDSEGLSDRFVRFMDKQVGFGEVFDMLDKLTRTEH
ncbi:MAG: hypothetical protein K2Z81_12290 [Cyanobacteria bacterium]|nr:hypothetical protein [Cyanobacteriota bacterium]